MKISEAEREEVKRMYFEQGMTRKDIASTKGLSQRYVSAIINNTDMGHGHRTTGRRKPPAGRITFEMIDEVMNSLSVGDAVLVDNVEDEDGYTYNTAKRCPIIGKYKHIFAVQVGKCVSAFKYVDLLLEDGVSSQVEQPEETV